MKQYTTPEQTAKLIELGFEKPMWRVARKFDDQSPRIAITSFGKLITSSYENVFAYAIGELIEMLGVHLSSIYYIGIEWFVNAEGIERRRDELIDALFDMIVVLKEEGVI